MGYWPDLSWKVFFIIKNIFIMKNLTRPISVKRWKPPVLAVFSVQFLAVFSEDLHQDLHQTVVRNKYVMQCNVT